LNLQVASGEVCGFLGANGSGKTTTIRMLCGLLTPDGGSGTCLGLDIIADAPRIRRRVGYQRGLHLRRLQYLEYRVPNHIRR
jgi:ABC-type multidrug transport system ATPase subunit